MPFNIKCRIYETHQTSPQYRFCVPWYWGLKQERGLGHSCIEYQTTRSSCFVSVASLDSLPRTLVDVHGKSVACIQSDTTL